MRSLLVWVCLANTWQLQESRKTGVEDGCDLTQYLPVSLEHDALVFVTFLWVMTRHMAVHLEGGSYAGLGFGGWRKLCWVRVWRLESNMAQKAQQKASVRRSSCLPHAAHLEADCSAEVGVTLTPSLGLYLLARSDR